MDDITASSTVDEEGGRTCEECDARESAERDCEAHAHDRLLSLLITAEHRLVHAY